MGYMTSSVASARLDALVAAHPSIATRGRWPAGHAGATAGYVKVGTATASSPAARPRVLVSGGVHARELAPPDALISFLDRLLTAYDTSSPLVYPSWTQPTTPPATYAPFTITWPEVQAIVEQIDLFVAPMVNPDGRDWVLAPLPRGSPATVQELHKMWRKNRRPAPAGSTGDWCIGVDLNRNFAIVWDFNAAYSAAGATAVSSSTNPCHREIYVGASAESEPETQNLAGLMRAENVGYFLDVHQYGRQIIYPWGIETNQTVDSTQSFTNPAWDHRRDGPGAGAYEEWVPAATRSALDSLGQAMRASILAKAGPDATAQARSTYAVNQSATGLYATSGACDDYCFSRWFTARAAGGSVAPVLAFTIEVGTTARGRGDDDGGFAPHYVRQYPKLEREIHAAVWAFLTSIVRMPSPAPSPSPPPPPGTPVPSPTPAPTGSSGPCFIASEVYREAGHPSVEFLRNVRDVQLPASRTGAIFARLLASAYTRVGPRTAVWIGRRTWARRAVRSGLLVPLVWVLGAVSGAFRARPRLRAAALMITFTVFALTPAALIAVGITWLLRPG